VTGLAAAVFSLAMIAAFVLIGFGVKFALGPQYRKNGLLMITAGVVILANVGIWTI